MNVLIQRKKYIYLYLNDYMWYNYLENQRIIYSINYIKVIYIYI